jgi:N-acetylglucosaminyldiphosphoundecaprenol N-acetyl-beta-D-mannosaminyltransferase
MTGKSSYDSGAGDALANCGPLAEAQHGCEDTNVASAQEMRTACVWLGGVAFDNVSMEEAVGRVDALVRARRRALVVTPNVDHLVRLRRDREFEAIVRGADLVLADGQPIVWLSRLAGTPVKERVAGSELFPRLCAHAARAGWRVFFLGGQAGAADGARAILEARYPGLNITGTYYPPMLSPG